MSIVSGTVGSILGANEQERATETNRQNVQETNQLNRDMFEMSRGSDGSAVLPTYLTSASGTPWEQDVLGRDLMALWESGGTAQESIDRNREIAGRYEETSAQAGGVARSIFDGGLEDRLSSSLDPVKQKRLKLAGTARQAALDALSDSLAAIDQVNRRKGYGGDSLTTQRLGLDARRRAYQEGAGATAGAELQNAIDEQALANYIANLQLSNMDLPTRAALNDINFENTPGNAALDDFGRRLQPLTFLRIGPGAYQYDHLPQVQANPSAAQLALMAASQAGGSALDSFLSGQFRPTSVGAAPGVSWSGYANNFNSAGGAPYGGYLAPNQAGGASIQRSASDWAAFNAESANWE